MVIYRYVIAMAAATVTATSIPIWNEFPPARFTSTTGDD